MAGQFISKQYTGNTSRISRDCMFLADEFAEEASVAVETKLGHASLPTSGRRPPETSNQNLLDIGEECAGRNPQRDFAPTAVPKRPVAQKSGINRVDRSVYAAPTISPNVMSLWCAH
ncbi:hypothetical protein [Mesorhizobium sp.]|uniref:hypothetical protein n=1 Tax=Mesorhizobium sp. TaxID=1871066 RepID=UPI000FE419B2|nr:hypothetical protein [Mesorhizobium sp.]RWN96170.1 MAG: hypothetical protein EOS06_27310 [Mesorhizobium sp.]RWO75066.1 MAG: hypothetical protein EOS18_32420 [Mesorhizobium sp.]TJU75332.1 MAG: hypothetical protein E5Y15_29995 [Mesorhizobium sp.]